MNNVQRTKINYHQYFISLLIFPAMLLLSSCDKVTSTPGKNLDSEFYFNNGNKVNVTIKTNQLGLLVHTKASRKNINKIVKDLDASIVSQHKGGLYIIKFTEKKDRKVLNDLVIKLKESPFLSHAGIVVEVPGGKDPVIATNEFIVQFKQDISRKQIDQFNKDNSVKILMPNPHVKNQYLMAITGGDIFEISKHYKGNNLVQKAYPNFINVFYDTETLLNDALFGNQWHLRNTGQSGGTVDADADLSLAWDITLGNANTIVAILENGGFDMTHADLVPNILINPTEVPGNNIDDDGNTWIDDVNGWDFGGCTAAAAVNCGDNNPSPATATEDHGTSVAGVAAARGNNTTGVSGSCPNCSLLLMRTGYTASDFAKSLAFGYAQQRGARIISNSWGGGGAMPNTVAAINNVTAAGVVVLFASGNTTNNVCTGAATDPRVSLAGVIAVSSSSNQDRKVFASAVGNCIDILSPSHRGYNAAEPYTGTLNVTTTDRTGAAGYNNTNPVNNCPSAENAPPPANARDYTQCFGGTSSATPLTAGIVGLLLTTNNTLTRVQVQNLLQDTADRIEDSVGTYSDINGFSNPAGGPTHANGRVNAFEALRITTPVAQGGKSGVDVFIRDNRLDWGNTQLPSNTLYESVRGFIPHWQSVDIKVDAPPTYQTAPTTSAQFDAFVDEDPIESALNRVYVRVRNRGPVSASSVDVKLHWSFAGTALPALPTDFWSVFPADSSDTSSWNPMPVQTISNLGYSGSTVASTAADNAQIIQFDFNAPAVDPSQPNPRHYCLLAVLNSSQDPVSSDSTSSLIVDNITPNDNNVTHRNLSLQDNTLDTFDNAFYVRNPYPHSIKTVISISAPQGWGISTEPDIFNSPFNMAAGEEILVKLNLRNPKNSTSAEINVVQQRLDVTPAKVMGGMTYRIKAPSKPGEPDGTEKPFLDIYLYIIIILLIIIILACYLRKKR